MRDAALELSRFLAVGKVEGCRRPQWPVCAAIVKAIARLPLTEWSDRMRHSKRVLEKDAFFAREGRNLIHDFQFRCRKIRYVVLD
jgi:hypothetical protein